MSFSSRRSVPPLWQNILIEIFLGNIQRKYSKKKYSRAFFCEAVRTTSVARGRRAPLPATDMARVEHVRWFMHNLVYVDWWWRSWWSCQSWWCHCHSFVLWLENASVALTQCWMDGSYLNVQKFLDAEITSIQEVAWAEGEILRETRPSNLRVRFLIKIAWTQKHSLIRLRILNQMPFCSTCLLDSGSRQTQLKEESIQVWTTKSSKTLLF